MEERKDIESGCINDAVAYFDSGFNCSEAVLKAFNEHYRLGLMEDFLKVATGFGAGIGASKDICGSLTGGVMVLSLLSGRATAQDPLGAVYAAEGALCRRFREEFGSTNCGGLTEAIEWGSHNHHSIAHSMLLKRVKLWRILLPGIPQ